MVVSVGVYDAALQVVAEEVKYSQAPCLEVDRLNKYKLDCGDGCVLEPRLLQDNDLEAVWAQVHTRHHNPPRDLDSGLLVGFY